MSPVSGTGGGSIRRTFALSEVVTRTLDWASALLYGRRFLSSTFRTTPEMFSLDSMGLHRCRLMAKMAMKIDKAAPMARALRWCFAHKFQMGLAMTFSFSSGHCRVARCVVSCQRNPTGRTSGWQGRIVSVVNHLQTGGMGNPQILPLVVGRSGELDSSYQSL